MVTKTNFVHIFSSQLKIVITFCVEPLKFLRIPLIRLLSSTVLYDTIIELSSSPYLKPIVSPADTYLESCNTRHN